MLLLSLYLYSVPGWLLSAPSPQQCLCPSGAGRDTAQLGYVSQVCVGRTATTMATKCAPEPASCHSTAMDTCSRGT